jgi:hypothetical protein
VRDVGQGDLHGVTCYFGFVILISCCACAVVVWMRFTSRTLDVAGCGAAGEQQLLSCASRWPSSFISTICRYLELVEHHKESAHADFPLSEACLWVKWRSDSSLLSQVPPPLHALNHILQIFSFRPRLIPSFTLKLLFFVPHVVVACPLSTVSPSSVLL